MTLLARADMLNDRSSAMALLQTRRSSRPRDLIAPGPDVTELKQILSVAARTPDHGKLHPWRFVHVPRAARADLRALLERASHAAGREASRLELEGLERFAHQAPTLIVVMMSPVPSAKIPVWEQELSCGAACMNLITAAHAAGYSAGWVTGWAAYSPMVLEAFGTPHERIAGFIFIGTPGLEPEERERPALDQIVSDWPPSA